MTLDEMIAELQKIRRKSNGDVDIALYHVNDRGAVSLDETPNLYLGFMHGNLAGNVSSILIGHPEDHKLIVNWEPWMGNLRLERFIVAYQEEPANDNG